MTIQSVVNCQWSFFEYVHSESSRFIQWWFCFHSLFRTALYKIYITVVMWHVETRPFIFSCKCARPHPEQILWTPPGIKTNDVATGVNISASSAKPFDGTQTVVEWSVTQWNIPWHKFFPPIAWISVTRFYCLLENHFQILFLVGQFYVNFLQTTVMSVLLRFATLTGIRSFFHNQ